MTAQQVVGDRPRARWGVRGRVLSTVLGLAALSMLLAGSTLLFFEWRSALWRIDAGLANDVAQFRQLVDPTTGQTFTTTEQLINTAVQRQVPARDEAFLGVVDGVPRFVNQTRRPVEIENEAVFARIRTLTVDDPVTIESAETSRGTVRYAAVPAKVVGAPDTGVLVIAYVLAPSQQAILDDARLYGIVAGVSLAVVGVVGWLVAGRLLRPLRLLREAASNISSHDLSLRIPVTGDDDVSDLTRTVNGMLDRLQGAFETQQRFLDDAGHELRTPMTIIQGHLEVLDVSDPSDVVAVRALVLDELQRMARLVDDLIVLAKARRPDFLRPQEVDLDVLLDDTLEKARALGPRTWQLDALAERSILADPQRLTQALLQLAENAVRHTRPDDTVALGAAVTGGTVRLWVRDSGVGIALADQARIFERFGRAGTAQVRGDEGSGLGLSIVGAIAEAHGGTVQVDSAPGAGATFTVVLPGAVLVPRIGRDRTPEWLQSGAV